MSLVVDAAGWAHHLVTLAVAAGFAGWHWWFVVAHPQWCERRTWTMVGYFAGVLAFAAVLVTRSDAFQVFVPACYVLAFVALPGWWTYIGVLAVNLPVLLVTGMDLGSVLINIGVVTPLAALFGTMVRAMEREAIRRRETNSELVAMAAENTRLQELLVAKAKDAGVAHERARLAREIHDTVAQGLTGIVTQLEAIGEVSAQARGRLDTARNLARTSLDEVRRSIDALRPGPLLQARLCDAVREAVSAWTDQYEVSARFSVTGEPVPAHSEVEVTLLRATQETLSNVGRHAEARRVDVTLSYMEDLIVLDVRDDGIGFNAASAGGFGLTALRQRVAALAGTVEVESSPAAGTAVSVTVPSIRAGT
ncbi:sensor histidine kinase [Micromonospora tarensis]|uniref:Oxygen sensor histidine kinase NreB n=1 Tax=Micromonospora tarensis TaxID=2806100 RepID=A0ABS1YG67_9ACTN|nr:sensor histidine kinase [Micromonospora tarensis]MBM0276313.1 sensor histidine kinase [Micromonospora tarensis]